MTVKECYEKGGNDYDGVVKRLGSEGLVKRFALKFLKDPSFQELKGGTGSAGRRESLSDSSHIKRCLPEPWFFQPLHRKRRAYREIKRQRNCRQ